MSKLFSFIKLLFGRRWWWKTLIVIAAMMVMAGLGNWQLDRLEQRRAHNAQLLAQLESEPLRVDGGPLPEAPTALVDRKAVVSGRYDYARQIAIKNQTRQGQPGAFLVTPFVIEGSDRAILVNRGWVPFREGTPERWGQFQEAEELSLTGHLQMSQPLPEASSTGSVDNPQLEWFRLDIDKIQPQMPYALMPVYFNVALEADRHVTTLPIRIEPATDLNEGSHLGYALQWYAFALIAGSVYIGVVRRQEQERLKPKFIEANPFQDERPSSSDNQFAH
ncbi:MAG: SURF1 family protein [Caldilineaceae bacterium]|nr:SURF1 family protein [Caldilineaceae bacterium]